MRILRRVFLITIYLSMAPISFFFFFLMICCEILRFRLRRWLARWRWRRRSTDVHSTVLPERLKMKSGRVSLGTGRCFGETFRTGFMSAPVKQVRLWYIFLIFGLTPGLFYLLSSLIHLSHVHKEVETEIHLSHEYYQTNNDAGEYFKEIPWWKSPWSAMGFEPMTFWLSAIFS